MRPICEINTHRIDIDGMWLMLLQEKPDNYVLATSETHSVREFVELAFHEVRIKLEWCGKGVEDEGCGAKNGKVLVEINPQYFRPTKVDIVLGNPKKAEAVFGLEEKNWFPKLFQ